MTKIQKKSVKITYRYIDSEEGKKSLDGAYNVLFDAVCKKGLYKYKKTGGNSVK